MKKIIKSSMLYYKMKIFESTDFIIGELIYELKNDCFTTGKMKRLYIQI